MLRPRIALAALIGSIGLIAFLALRGAGEGATGSETYDARPLAPGGSSAPATLDTRDDLEELESADSRTAGAHAPAAVRSPGTGSGPLAGPGRRVQGVVHDPLGRLALGASVRVIEERADGSHASHTVDCDDDAAFAFTLPAGSEALLRAEHETCAPSEGVPLLAHEEPPAELVLQLRPGGGLRVGLSRRGLDIQEATATVVRGEELISTRALVGGEVLFPDLSPGTYEVRLGIQLQGPGTPLRASQPAEVYPNAETTVSFGGAGLHRVQGRVDLFGEPQPGATVILSPPGQRLELHSGRTQEDGTFELLAFAPPPYELTASHEQRTLLVHLDPARARAQLELELAGALLSGVVLDASGEPRAGVSVTTVTCQEERELSPLASPEARAETDEAGRFSLESFGSRCVELSWHDAEGVRQVQRVMGLERGEPSPGLELRERSPQRLIVEVDWPEPQENPWNSPGAMQPVIFPVEQDFRGSFHRAQTLGPQVAVAVFDAQGRHLETFRNGAPNPQGILEFPIAVTEERVRLLAYTDGFSTEPHSSAVGAVRSLSSAAGHRVRPRLMRAGRLRVHAENPEGRRLGAQFRLLDFNGVDLWPALGQNETGGRHYLQALAPGIYRVEARNHGGAVASREVRIRAGEIEEVVLTLP